MDRGVATLAVVCLTMTGGVVLGGSMGTLACSVQNSDDSFDTELAAGICQRILARTGLSDAGNVGTDHDYKLLVRIRNSGVAGYRLIDTQTGSDIASGDLDIVDAPIDKALMSHLPLIIARNLSNGK